MSTGRAGRLSRTAVVAAAATWLAMRMTVFGRPTGE
jgi:hypothetical protein